MKFALFTASLFVMFTAKSQQVYLFEQGVGDTLNGETIYLDINSSFVEHKVHVKNTSGSAQSFEFTRIIIDTTSIAASSFGETFCDCFTCFTTGQMTTASWTSPYLQDMDNGDTCLFKPSWMLQEGGSAHFRYLITDANNGNPIDSIDYILTSYVSNNTDISDELIIYPNPVSSELNITLNDQQGEGANFYLYNLLGEIVLNINLTPGTNTIDLLDFPDGLYTYTLISKGSPLSSQKLVIKH